MMTLQMKRSLQGIAVMAAAALAENEAEYADNFEIGVGLDLVGEGLEMVVREIERLTLLEDTQPDMKPLKLLGWIAQHEESAS